MLNHFNMTYMRILFQQSSNRVLLCLKTIIKYKAKEEHIINILSYEKCWIQVSYTLFEKRMYIFIVNFEKHSPIFVLLNLKVSRFQTVSKLLLMIHFTEMFKRIIIKYKRWANKNRKPIYFFASNSFRIHVQTMTKLTLLILLLEIDISSIIDEADSRMIRYLDVFCDKSQTT